VTFHEEDGTFEVAGVYKFWEREHVGNPDQEIQSTYRVTREGELRQFAASVKFNFAYPVLMMNKMKVAGRIEGVVHDHRLTPRVEIDEPFEYTLELGTVAVSQRGSVLNPLQPFNRIPGLRPGQRWRMPLVHPLDDVKAALATKFPFVKTAATAPPFLDAEVLPGPEFIDRGARNAGGMCLVIVYSSDEVQARTWVRKSDGLVLRQEVTKDGETLILQRD
jgi:hypothetical protein